MTCLSVSPPPSVKGLDKDQTAGLAPGVERWRGVELAAEEAPGPFVPGGLERAGRTVEVCDKVHRTEIPGSRMA